MSTLSTDQPSERAPNEAPGPAPAVDPDRDFRALTDTERAEAEALLPTFGIPADAPVRCNSVGGLNHVYFVDMPERPLVLRVTKSDGWAAVALDPMKRHRHLAAEVEVMRQLEEQGFPLTPRIIPAAYGERIVEHAGQYATLTNRMPGIRIAGWEDPGILSPDQLRSFFSAIGGLDRALDPLPVPDALRDTTAFETAASTRPWLERIFALHDSTATRMLRPHAQALSDCARDALQGLEAYADVLGPPRLRHFDIHPSNAHFLGEEVCGIFDFDLLRADGALTDLAAGISMSCYESYYGEHGAVIDPARAETAIDGFMEGWARGRGLSKRERAALVASIRAYSLFQFRLMYKDVHRTCIEEGEYEDKNLASGLRQLVRTDFAALGG